MHKTGDEAPAKAHTAPPGPPKQNLSQRTLTGFLWTFSGTGAQGVIRILVLALLARLLTPEEFGVVGAALIIIGSSGIVAQMGIGPALVQRAELRTEHLRAGFTLSIALGVMLTSAVWGAAPYISGFFGMEELESVVQVLSITFLLRSISLVAESLLQRELRFGLLAWIDVSSYGIGFGVVGITLALFGLGIWALTLAYLAETVLKTTFLFLGRRHPARPSFNAQAVRDLMSFGVGMTIAKVFNYLATQADNIAVGRWLGAGALGIYGRAYQLLVMPATLFGSVVNKVMFPALAQLQATQDRLSAAYRDAVGLIALMALPAGALMFILAPELVHVLLGPQWGEVVLPFRVLALGTLWRTSYKISDTLAKATGAVYRRAWRQALYAALVLIGAWIGTTWGVPGVAMGVLAAITINFGLMAHLGLRLSGLSWQEFGFAHWPGVCWAASVTLVAVPVAALCRMLDLAAVFSLMISASVSAAAVLVGVRVFPDIFLGRAGKRFLRLVEVRFPGVGRLALGRHSNTF